MLGETNDALELREGAYPPVIYFPRKDIAMAFLDGTSHSSHCPHKGDAHYFSIVTKSQTIANAAWSYEDPENAVDQIKGYLAFYPMDEVTVESI